VSEDRDHGVALADPRRLAKRVIVKPDGRYLILYEPAALPGPEPAPAAGEPADRESGEAEAR